MTQSKAVPVAIPLSILTAVFVIGGLAITAHNAFKQPAAVAESAWAPAPAEQGVLIKLKIVEEKTEVPPVVSSQVSPSAAEAKEHRDSEVKEAVAEYAVNPRLALAAFAYHLDKVATERPNFNIPGLLSWTLRDTISDSADGYGRYFSAYMRFLRQNPAVARAMFSAFKDTEQMREMARKHAHRFSDGMAALMVPFNQQLGAMAAHDGYQCFYGRKAGQECVDLVLAFESYYKVKATFNLIWIVGSLNRTFNQGGMQAVEVFQDLGLSFLELGGIEPLKN